MTTTLVAQDQSKGDSPRTLGQQLTAVNRMISVGEFDRAIHLASSLAGSPVARRPAQALLALAQAMSERRESASATLDALGDPAEGDKAEVLLAAGSAWFRLGEIVEAIRFYEAGVQQAPDHPLINARLGACLLGAGRTEVALPYLERAVALMPDAGGAWLNLAVARLETGRPEDALAALDKAADLPDKETDKYNMTRAEVLSRLGRHGEAAQNLRNAAEQGIDGATEALISLLSSQGKHDDAWQTLREALEQSPESPRLLDLAAELAQFRGHFGEADHFLGRALQIAPDNAALWIRRATLAGRRISEESGRQAADRALELTADKPGPLRARALAAHAHVLIEENRHADGEAAYREAIAVMPRCVPALTGLGNLLMQLGRVSEAVALFEEVREIAPLQGWSQLIHARKVPDDPKILEQMAEAAHRPSLEGPVQSHLLFNLASAWERSKDYQKAWTFATEANAAAKDRLDYRPEVHRARIEREIARFSKAFIQSRAGYGDPSHLPVFVLGMPRSGTTLVEQILGSHSQVFGAGELSLVPEFIQKLNAWELKTGTRREYPECIDDMTEVESKRFASKHLAELQAFAPAASRIVDKLPHNFEHIGLIKLLFPNAKILHMKREPRDVAMSNYFTDYAAKFGGMGFAYDLTWIGEQLVDHQRLMDHWHSVFPGEILEVDYDALVEDVEGWAHKIIKHLGLAWEEGVLAFQELDRAVKTASVWQVRQPVYKTSKAKWRHYEKHLAPLEAALAEVPPMPVPMPQGKLRPGLFLEGMDALQSGRLEDAEACFRDLIAARSSHAAAHHFLGASLYQQKKPEEARRMMRRSLELLPRQAQWLENVARVEEALGNREEAARLRQRAGQPGEAVKAPTLSPAI